MLIPQIASLPPGRWPDLMTQLNRLASERHIQVYFNNAPAESVMNDYGWSGTINPRHASDFMYEVESNFGATKANHFITRSYNVDLSVVNGQLRHIVSLHLKNSEPYFEYEGGNNYNCYLRLYLPANATGLAVTSLAQSNKIPDVSAPTGYQEIDGWFEIDVSWYWGYGQRTIRFQWDTPYDASANQQSIYWQKQPGTENDAISIAWHSGGHTYGASGVLDTDKEIELTPSAISLIAGQAGSATVPSLSL